MEESGRGNSRGGKCISDAVWLRGEIFGLFSTDPYLPLGNAGMGPAENLSKNCNRLEQYAYTYGIRVFIWAVIIGQQVAEIGLDA